MVEQANLTEFSKEKLDKESEEKEEACESILLSHELEFTGNWFIDAGILGFVNLMEEVYGWNLENEKLKQIIHEPSKLFLYFSYAFWYKIIKETTERWLEKEIFKKEDLKKEKNIDPYELKKNLREKVINRIDEYNLFFRDKLQDISSFEEIKSIIIKLNEDIKKIIKKQFLEYRKFMKKVFASNKKTLLQQLDSIGIIAYNDFFTNLMIFHSASNIKGKEMLLLNNFQKLILSGFVRKDKKIKTLPTDILDKTLSPFIHSASDFHNENYGEPLTLRNLKNFLFINPVIFILTIPFSFIKLKRKNYFFYSSDLNFTYSVNMKLKSYIKQNNNKKLFLITWDSILDTLVEYKSDFSLENMYILEFSEIQNQQIQNVEYIGISKLQANILIDDSIRAALNTTLRIDNDKQQSSVWVLEEFIKNRSLYEVIFRHTLYCINNLNGMGIIIKTSFYSLAIDAKIKENNEIELFSSDFFRGYGSLVDKIKDCYSLLNQNANNISKLFRNQEERIKFSYSLMSTLKKRNRIAFVNILLKKFLENNGEKKEVAYLNKFIFKNIISNDISWENYALALIIGILSFGGDISGRESEN